MHSFVDRGKKAVHVLPFPFDLHAHTAVGQILHVASHVVSACELQGHISKTHPLHPPGVMDRLVVDLAGCRHGDTIDKPVGFRNQ